MCYKIEKRQIFYSICALLLISGAAYGAVVAEIEDNNDLDHAQTINAGDTINGKMDGNYVVTDYYKLTLPQSGIVTLTTSGYTDGKFFLGAADFGQGWGTGSVTGENGKPVKLSFAAPKNKPGSISVGVSTVSGVTGGYNDCYWAIIQLNTDGPYYIMNEKPGVQTAHCVPSTNEGKPVLPTLPYQLEVSLQPVPDQYEPNYVEGSTKEDMLAKGIIKTITLGQEISAYLFNEFPQVMKGTPGYETSSSFGGENDVDVYHVSLSQPDTVNVHLGNFPVNANSRIIITQSDGSWDESTTGATDFSMKVTKPGNVFIEISRGRGTGNLVYSTTPYKLLVTTGGATSTVTPTFTPTVTPAVTVKPSGNELITNGAFLNGLSGWTIQDWYKPSDGKGEVTAESDGIRFHGTSGNNHIGIMQTLNADVTGCAALNLKAVIKADEQTLGGTGWNGRESPIAVFARYTDIYGVVHGNLGEDPTEQNRMLWTGLYIIEPTGSGITDYGIKTQKGQWYTYEFDLMKLSPKPMSIDIVGAEGAGWPARDGKVKSISLTCTGAAATHTATVTGTNPKPTVTATSNGGKPDFSIDITPTELNVNPGDNMRFTVTILPTGGFNEPVEIYVKTKALGIEKDFGLMKTMYPPYQPYIFEKQVPENIPGGTTINGYVTAKGGGITRDAGTITVNVPGFGLLLAIAAFGTAILIRKRK